MSGKGKGGGKVIESTPNQWEPYTEVSLRGSTEHEAVHDDHYITGIFGLDGNPWAVHPKGHFAPPKEDVMALVKIIDKKDDEEFMGQIYQKGCMFNNWKFSLIKHENYIVLQRKKKSDEEDLKQAEKWPLCAYKTKKAIVIRISKQGPDTGRQNVGIVLAVGEYLVEANN